MCPTLHIDYTGRTPICFMNWQNETGVDAIARNIERVRRSRKLLEPCAAMVQSYASEVGLSVDWIIRIRHFLLLLGLPSALGNSTLVTLPIFPNSTMPDHSTMGMVGWTSIFLGSNLQASRSSTLRWARSRMDWQTFSVR